eukprot:scaffold264981_cov34-Tisochrysis_lutea.AAC.3
MWPGTHRTHRIPPQRPPRPCAPAHEVALRCCRSRPSIVPFARTQHHHALCTHKPEVGPSHHTTRTAVASARRHGERGRHVGTGAEPPTCTGARMLWRRGTRTRAPIPPRGACLLYARGCTTRWAQVRLLRNAMRVTVQRAPRANSVPLEEGRPCDVGRRDRLAAEEWAARSAEARRRRSRREKPRERRDVLKASSSSTRRPWPRRQTSAHPRVATGAASLGKRCQAP